MCIRDRCMDIFKPDGKVIKFWLSGNSENHIRDIITKKNYKDIEWIRKEIPPFI